MQTDKTQRLGLALSGGGFRATLFHLGVVRFLYDAGLLKQVTHICSVSGGSILAAYLLLNWKRFNDAPADIDSATAEIVRFARTDLRGRAFRRWLFFTLVPPFILLHLLRFFFFGLIPKLGAILRRIPLVSCIERNPWRLGTLLRHEYDRGLFKNSCCNNFAETPELYILATDMQTGEPCAFSRDRFAIGTGNHKRVDISGNHKVSLAVAASAAFPPILPPVAVDWQSTEGRRYTQKSELLTDGGVFDNLGLAKLRALWAESKEPGDGVIISDAGAPFRTSQQATYGFFVSRATRASDILMSRVTALEEQAFEREHTANEAIRMHCRIWETVNRDIDPTAMDPNTQKLVAQLRTDLDSFSELEVDRLFKHGYTIARRAYSQTPARPSVEFGRQVPSPVESNRLPTDPETVDKHLKKGSQIKTLRAVFHWSDPIAWLNVVYGLAVIAVLGRAFAWPILFPVKPGISSQTQQPLLVDTGRLASALKEHDDADIKLGTRLEFTGSIVTDNSYFESPYPYIEVSKRGEDPTHYCVIVFRDSLPREERLTKIVTVVGQVVEDDRQVFGGRWLVLCDNDTLRLADPD